MLSQTASCAAVLSVVAALVVLAAVPALRLTLKQQQSKAQQPQQQHLQQEEQREQQQQQQQVLSTGATGRQSAHMSAKMLLLSGLPDVTADARTDVAGGASPLSSVPAAAVHTLVQRMPVHTDTAMITNSSSSSSSSSTAQGVKSILKVRQPISSQSWLVSPCTCTIASACLNAQ
jgi:type II secretory pathway pseudopilin PulG